MEETTTYTQFIDQPVSNLNSKEILDLAKKNLKIFGEIEQKQFPFHAQAYISVINILHITFYLFL